MPKLVHLPLLLIALGAILLLSATLWAHFKDPRDYWSEEEAQTLTDAGLDYHGQAHRMAHDHPGAPDAASQEKYDQARARYGRFRETFGEAQERYERPMRLMRWSGMACLVVGILAYYVARAAARE